MPASAVGVPVAPLSKDRCTVAPTGRSLMVLGKDLLGQCGSVTLCLLQFGGSVACPPQILRLHCRSETSRFLCLQLRSPGLEVLHVRQFEVAFECIFIPQPWSSCFFAFTQLSIQ